MAKDKVLRERDVERYLVQQVKKAGGEVRKLEWIGRRGAPDRIVMLPSGLEGGGVTIFVELKAPGKKPEAHQLREHNRMRRMGQEVEVIDSLEAVDDLLRGWV
jgi:hypothetical protein